MVLALLVLLAGIVLAVGQVRPLVSGLRSDGGDFEGTGTTPVTIVVKNGDTGQAIGQTLEQAGVVKSVEAFSAALTSSPKPDLQPGSYQLKKEMSAASALALLRDPSARQAAGITIPEGRWKSEVFQILSKGTGTPIAEYTKAAASPELGLPASAKGDIEGYLWPATYEFDDDASALDQLKKLVATAEEKHRELGLDDEKGRRTLIIASLIEAEAGSATDRPKVARVILNRLDADMPLAFDSTVGYGVGRRGITTTDEERADDNLYNTYKHKGLPVGPVSNPGAASIKAALQPADGDWLFFVSINPETGETLFAEKDREHAENVKKFQQWCQQNPGKC